MQTSLPDIYRELQSNGFAPKLIKEAGSTTELTGMSFFCASIVKDKYIEYYRQQHPDCKVHYNQHAEEIVIKLADCPAPAENLF